MVKKSYINKKRILIVAAHPDDEVLGCGGTITKSTAQGCKVYIVFITNGVASRNRKKRDTKNEVNERKAAAIKACKIMGAEKPNFLDFQDNQLDKYPLLKIVKTVEKFIKKYSPSVIFSHYSGDLNIDHQIVSKAVVTACRPQKQSTVKNLLFFEVPSSTEWQITKSSKTFNPNWFEDISSVIKKKLNALQAYKSELRKWPHPRSKKGVEVLALWRGATIGVEAAEAFILGRKIS